MPMMMSTKDKGDLQTILFFYFNAIHARALNNRKKRILRVINNRILNGNIKNTAIFVRIRLVNQVKDFCSNLKLKLSCCCIHPTQHSVATAVLRRGATPAVLGTALSIRADAISSITVATCASWTGWRRVSTTIATAVPRRGTTPAVLGAARSICADAVSAIVVALNLVLTLSLPRCRARSQRCFVVVYILFQSVNHQS